MEAVGSRGGSKRAATLSTHRPRGSWVPDPTVRRVSIEAYGGGSARSRSTSLVDPNGLPLNSARSTACSSDAGDEPFMRTISVLSKKGQKVSEQI